MNSSSRFPEKEPNIMSQTAPEIVYNDVFRYILQDHGEEVYLSFQQQIESFDFEKHVEETLAKSAKICEEQLEAEKAVATEKFFQQAYENLVNMECSPSDVIGDEDREKLRKDTERFLQESYDNLLHMFDGVSSDTTEGGNECLNANEEGECTFTPALLDVDSKGAFGEGV